MKKVVFISLAIVAVISISITSAAFAKDRMIIRSGDDDEVKKVKVVEKTHAFLGIHMDDLSSKLRKKLDYSKDKGVWIVDVIEDSPAEKAGLKEDDILIVLDGEEIENAKHLGKLLKDMDPGEMVDVVVFRDGGEKEFRIELGENKRQFYTINIDDGECLDDEFGIRSYKVNVDAYKDALQNFSMISSGKLHMGVRIEKLNEDLAKYFDVEGGVLILEVLEDTPAEEAGMKSGDVIVRVGDEEVEDAGDIADALADVDEDDEEVIVVVVRKGEKRTITFDVEDLRQEGTAIWFGADDKAFRNFRIAPPKIKMFKKDNQKGLELLEDIRLDELKKEIEILEKRLKKLEKEDD